MCVAYHWRNRLPSPDLVDSSSPSSSSSSSSSSTYSNNSSFCYIRRASTNMSSCDSGNSLKRTANYPDKLDDVLARSLTRAQPTSVYKQLPSTSVETYNSAFSDSGSLDSTDDEGSVDALPAPTEDDIPPMLPQYRASIVDPLVRPSTPEAFGHLFPSMDRLSIHHDDLTYDGNMNLRVDTSVHYTGRRPLTIQLFHLRMQDLARREFSLRRYCRDSGREVCNSRRAYAQPRAVYRRPAIQRSVSSAFHSLKSPFHRTSNTSLDPQSKRPPTGDSGASSSWDTASMRFMRMRTDSWSGDRAPPPASTLVPTDSIKLEFSNYARVDVTRRESRGSIRYVFKWWGHEYAWRRVVDATLGTTSFHLVRDSRGEHVAHIMPEVRSPNQVEADEWAGGWVPPCHMWISDQSIVDSETDVADIIVATGLIALVDDCIKARWSVKRPRRRDHAALSDFVQRQRPRSLMQDMFRRRRSERRDRAGPMRGGNAVSVY